jgi:hypothetical protein
VDGTLSRDCVASYSRSSTVPQPIPPAGPRRRSTWPSPGSIPAARSLRRNRRVLFCSVVSRS